MEKKLDGIQQNLGKIEQKVSKTEQMGYKSLELMRFYISKDIHKIEEAISKNKYELPSTIMSAMVNVLIACFFRNDVEEFNLKGKITVIIVLFIFSCILEKLICFSRKWYSMRKKESGREAMKMLRIYERVDEFDNIACDGILICIAYMEQYGSAKTDELRDFYYFEIIHYMKKSRDVFLEINMYPERYVKANDKNLLDAYRISNFVKLSQQINAFLQSHKDEYKSDENIFQDIKSINEDVQKW